MDVGAVEAGQRAREWFHGLTVPTRLWCVLRVDGRGFSRMTEDRFDKPFDIRVRDCMVAAAQALVADLGAVYGYTQSDEISVVLPPAFDLFGRGVEKLVSVSAGMASAEFTHASGGVAHFDSRVWIGAGVDDVLDYLTWRQADAARSALNGWCYWTLRQEGCTAVEATSRLHRASRSDKNELLFARGVNVAELPAWQRSGIGLRREEYRHTGHDPVRGEDVTVLRRRLAVDLELPFGDCYREMLRTVLAG